MKKRLQLVEKQTLLFLASMEEKADELKLFYTSLNWPQKSYRGSICLYNADLHKRGLNISPEKKTKFSLNRSNSPTRLFSKSGPVRKLLFSEIPLSVDTTFETRRTFRGLLGLVTGWCARYQTRSGVVSLKVTDLTYPFSMSVSSVFWYISLNVLSFLSFEIMARSESFPSLSVGNSIW